MVEGIGRASHLKHAGSPARRDVPMQPLPEAAVVVRPQSIQSFIPNGVQIIETRTLLAYGIILLMVAAAVIGIALVRYNSADRKIARQRQREHALRDEQNHRL